MIAVRPTLLLVDDDVLIQETLGFLLGSEFEITLAADRPAAIACLREHRLRPQIALIDLGLPPCPHRPDEGLALIGELLDHDPHCKIVVLSGQNELEHARHARTLGALDFVAKPAQPEILLDTLRRAARLYHQEAAAIGGRAGERLLGESPAMTALRDQLQRLARLSFPVLIEGESGTGKEVAANILHESGPQRKGPFVALNCAAIAPGLMEATLFGHARGAFTGAVAAQNGYFSEAANGTLFLDEIGELPLELQPKLLRVLENNEYQRVGETQRRTANTRIVAATNRDLAQEVRDGRFRADLFHRLSVLRLHMPPVRRMAGDRLLLLDHYLREFAVQMDLSPCRLDSDAVECWMAYDFPGNVRELRNIVIRLLNRYAGKTVERGQLEAELEADVPEHGSDTPPPPETAAQSPAAGDALSVLQTRKTIDLDAELRAMEHAYMAAALRLSRGNMSQAARMLGINRSTLYNRMDALARLGKPVTDDTTD